MKKLKKLSIGLLLLNTACVVGPDYVNPTIIMPDHFKEAPEGWKMAEPQEGCDRGNWWEIFDDPELNALEAELTSGNQNLMAAIAQYEQAKALVIEARSAYFPSVTGSYSVNKEKQSLSNDQVAAVGTSDTESSIVSGSNKPFNILNLTFDAIWEPDVWGAVRRNVESAVATAQSDAAYVALTRLLAQASLAQYYFQLRGLDANQELLEKTVKDYEKILKIVENQYHAGTVSRLSILQSQSLLQAAQAACVDNGVNRAIYEHAIAVLLGRAPADFCLPPNPLVSKTLCIPVDIPSQWLERRPDIAQAERSVASANALIGVAIAAYYPVLTLSGLDGYQADTLHRLFRVPAQFWNIGAMIAETLFDAGLNRSKVEAARAFYDQSVATYRQTVLTAFQDVEDQLASLRILDEEELIQKEAVKSADGALNIIINELKAGTAQTMDVLNQEIITFSIRQTMINVVTRKMVATALLVKAMGGGWDMARLPTYEWCPCADSIYSDAVFAFPFLESIKETICPLPPSILEEPLEACKDVGEPVNIFE